jgi:hypothetical protein
VHRRPLGRGRLLAAIGALIVLAGCVLPWFAATGGDTGLTPITTNAFADKGIVVFICAVLAVAAGASAWRTIEFIFVDPAGLRPDLAPGLWVVAIGLAFLARATYEISAERRI